MDAYREGKREREREGARVHRRGAILQPTSNSIIARGVYSTPYPSLTRPCLEKSMVNDGFFLPTLPLHAARVSVVLKEIEREINRRGCSVGLLPSPLLPSTRARRERRSAGRCSAEVMNLQIPWNGACCSLVAAVASARNRTPISLSLSLSLCPRLSTQPPPLPLGCVMEIAFARRERGGLGLFYNPTAEVRRNYYWANCILTNSKGVRV